MAHADDVGSSTHSTLCSPCWPPHSHRKALDLIIHRVVEVRGVQPAEQHVVVRTRSALLKYDSRSRGRLRSGVTAVDGITEGLVETCSLVFHPPVGECAVGELNGRCAHRAAGDPAGRCR